MLGQYSAASRLAYVVCTGGRVMAAVPVLSCSADGLCLVAWH
jgi:hypothetical protein